MSTRRRNAWHMGKVVKKSVETRTTSLKFVNKLKVVSIKSLMGVPAVVMSMNSEVLSLK